MRLEADTSPLHTHWTESIRRQILKRVLTNNQDRATVGLARMLIGCGASPVSLGDHSGKGIATNAADLRTIARECGHG